jgi:nifR3 family TIM-barrel protein
MREITRVAVEESNCPVTVKTRLGWDDNSIRIIEVAQMLEDCGIQALAIHARTRAQLYKGSARWSWLRRVKESAKLTIPLIGNGDASNPERIRAMFEETGVDGVMIGRGAIGNPWIFRDAKALMQTGKLPNPPNWEERLHILTRHLELKCEWLGERKGVLEMRKMYGGYFKGLPGSSQLRKSLMQESEKRRVLELLQKVQQVELDAPVVPDS